jgi:hypothetical protein
MQELLQAKYTNYANDDADYPIVTSIKKKGFMPTPRPTVASQALTAARKEALEKSQEEEKRFVMKRFQKVKGTFEKERELEASMRASTDSLRDECKDYKD